MIKRYLLFLSRLQLNASEAFGHARTSMARMVAYCLCIFARFESKLGFKIRLGYARALCSDRFCPRAWYIHGVHYLLNFHRHTRRQ